MKRNHLAALGLAAGAALASAVPAQEAPKKAQRVRAAVALRAAGPATPITQDELIKRRDAKLAEPWIKNAEWILDYDAARAAAAEQNAKMLAYFTRSYAP